MKIRPYKKADFNDVRFVCLNCDGPSDMSESTEHFILTTYCDYYIEQEPHNCFVAADENDRAIGYIICAEDFDSFNEVFFNEYFPRIPEENEQARYFASVSAELQKIHKNEYPAHFHIDILPEFHRMGLGHRLVDTLCLHLKNKGVKGIMLSVSADNNQGNAFYNKYGFAFIENSPFGNAYGIKLD